MIDKNRRRDSFLIQNIEAQFHQGGPVVFREERDGADQSRVRFANLGAALSRSVLAHDRAILGAAGFFKCAQGANCTDVIDGADEDAARPGGP